MKTFAFRASLPGLALTFLAFATASVAQVPGAAGPSSMSSALIKILGDVKPFTAKAQVKVLDSTQSEIASMPMDFAYLDKKVRVDLDMTQAKSANMPPETATKLKQAGMTHIVSIVRPDTQTMYIIYPEQKAYLPMPAKFDDVKVTSAEVGKETVDGHECIKNKVTVQDAKGEKTEATTWNATDMNKFPLRIQTTEKGNTSTIDFKQVQFAKPDASNFEPPAGYTKYNSPIEMMQAVGKMLEGGEKK